MSTGIGVGISSVFTSRPAGGPSIILEYSTSDYCETPVPSVITPSVIQPAPPAGVFTSSASGLVVNVTSGVFNVGVSQPGSYIITYTVGTQSATFPINIGPVIDATITGDSATCVGNAPVPADLTAVAGYSNYEWFKNNVSVQNGSSNTYTPAFDVAGTFTYKVIITDSSLSSVDCTKTSLDFTFTVNALPTILTASATGGFCSGSSTTITTTVSAGTVFAWYKDDVLIVGQTGSTLTVSEAGEYTATVTDGNGCTSLPSTGLEIEQFDSPTVTIATVPGTTICTGDTATLTANPTGGTGPYIYSWSTGGTGSSISVAPTTTTTYTVTVTDDNGCTGTASQEITPSTAGTAIASINNDAAMTFNGLDQYIELSSEINYGTTNTLSFWVNSSSTLTKDVFGANTNGGYLLKALNATDTLSYRSSTGAKTFDLSGLSSNPMKDGDWHHIAFTRKSSGLIQLYVDGDTVGAAQNLGGNTLFKVIGANYAKSVFFDGKLDEVAIWDSALSSCDVKGIYEATTTVNGQPKSANLLDTNTTIPAPVYWNRMGDS